MFPGIALAGWTATPAAGGETDFLIHHGAGTGKNFALGTRTNDADGTVNGVVEPASMFYQYNVTQGFVAHGTSGSSLFNSLDQVLGVASTIPDGQQTCALNQTINFGRFSVMYPVIAPYLNQTASLPKGADFSITTQLPDAVALTHVSFHWNAWGVSKVQIRQGSATGPVITPVLDPAGDVTSTALLTLAQTYYLQDASSGDSSGSANTLLTASASYYAGFPGGSAVPPGLGGGAYGFDPSTIYLGPNEGSANSTLRWMVESDYVRVSQTQPNGTDQFVTGQLATSGSVSLPVSDTSSYSLHILSGGKDNKLPTFSFVYRKWGSLSVDNNVLTASPFYSPQSVLSWVTFGVTSVQIRSGSVTGPVISGTLAPNGTLSISVPAANTTYYLQDASSGDSSGSAKTLSATEIFVGSSASCYGALTVDPNPYDPPDGRPYGTATVHWQASTGCGSYPRILVNGILLQTSEDGHLITTANGWADTVTVQNIPAEAKISLQNGANATPILSATFHVVPKQTSLAAPPPASILPQFAFGAGWYSALYFTNLSGSAVSFPVSFFSDSGTPLTVPSVGGSTTQVSLAANGTALIEAPNLGGLQQGYAEFTLPNGVAGYGVFRESIAGQPDQEAVVPFSDATATSSTLTWDETNFTTSVAIVNPSSSAATAAVTLRDASGNVIGTSSISLPPSGKKESTLQTLPGLGGMVGKRGSAQFSIPGGSVAVLGLRSYGPALTSIPTTAGSSQSKPSLLPQFAFGGGWYSALYFTNLTGSGVSFPVSFVSDAGTPLTVPAFGGSTTQVNLAAYGTAILEAPNVGGLQQGYAKFTLPSGVSGYGVFRESITGQPDQEAVVPLSDATSTSNTLTWDETNFTTSVALVNPGPSAATAAVTLQDGNGTVIGTSSIQIPATGKKESVLQTLPGLSGMAGKRGSAQFSIPGGSVAVLGLRSYGPALTSIPTK